MRFLKFLGKTIIVILLVVLIFGGLITFFMGKDNTFTVKKPHVLVLELKGVIVDSSQLIKKLKKADKNEFVKGIILKINSPGGGVAPSQEIYSVIRKMKKPVYAAISTLGASGGYYVASACDRIFAMPGSITGSIGVIMKFSNLKELYDKIGMKFITIKSGKFKDIGSSSRQMTKEEKELLQKAIMDVYEQFVDDIVRARGIDKEKLLKYADGRILTGNQAKKIGLVDELGTYEDAFNAMKKDFHLADDVILYKPEKKESVFSEIFKGLKKIKVYLQGGGGFYYLYTFD